MMKILAMSGSLRRVSSNTTLLRAVVGLAPEGVEIALYEGLGGLPHFNPDLDEQEAPHAVREFRARLQEADGVLLSSPEYAHGVPGTLKNALDWTVSSGEFYLKPVALLNASPRSIHAQAQLTEVLATMGARLMSEASITVPLAGKPLDEAGILAHDVIGPALKSALAAFVQAIRKRESVPESRSI